MPDTIQVTLPAELVPLMRRLADDHRVWSNRLAHDNGARQDDASRRIANDAAASAIDCGRIVRALDAAVRQPEFAL